MFKEFILHYWQDIAIWILFILAFMYLGWRSLSHFKKRSKGCGNQCKCSGKQGIKITLQKKQ